MKANDSLSKIPVVVKTSVTPDHLQRYRFLTKFGVLILLLLIPMLGIFRIDVSSGFIVLNRQIWFSDFHIVFGFWLALACTAIMFYSTVGTAFCGWVCPQNTFSTLMDSLTKRLLGKRAVIDWENVKSKVAAKKNKILNWFLLSMGILVSSLVLAILPIIYFISPEAIFSFLTLQPHASVSNSLYWIYSVFVVLVAVNLGVVRHYVCRFMCIYRMWQYLFKTSDSLHIEYDQSRKQECEKCNYCTVACMVDIDPRKTETFDSCTNCGACITACNSLHAKKNENGLLSFRFGRRKNKEVLTQRSISTLKVRSRWVLPVLTFGLLMFSFGMFKYNPYHLAVYKSDKHQGTQIHEYRINIANKIYQSGHVKVTVLGLGEMDYSLSGEAVEFSDAGRRDIFLTVKKDLTPGLHSFIVKAESDDGWQDQVQLQHFVTSG